ncbi:MULTISPECIES: histone deacetylase [unclassified Acinetobacter]|uniref:histone deacetylase n=1 Tax=unclassified Acinetobacter TaxID=196816 RepID=UPI0035B8A80F
MLKTCYSSRYYAITHTRSMEKLTAVAEVLAAEHIAELVDPGLIDINILKKLHNPAYVDAFVQGQKPLACMQGFKNWSPQLRDAILSVQAGQIVASEIALKDGISANIAQGFHHAVYEYGGSYCTFNGLALIAQHYPDKKIFILDCDQHGGNGTAEFSAKMENLFNFTIFGHRFGCMSHERSITHHIDQNTGNFEQYIAAIDAGFAQALEWQADLIIYQAGMDCHKADRFGSRWIDATIMFERDKYVFEQAKKLNLPLMFVLAGGYQPLQTLVPLHVNTFIAANEVYFPEHQQPKAQL